MHGARASHSGQAAQAFVASIPDKIPDVPIPPVVTSTATKPMMSRPVGEKLASPALAIAVPALISSKQDLVEELRGEKYVDVADAYGWQIRHGDAAFAGTPEAPVLEVTATDGAVETIDADHYLVAT